MGMPIRFGKKIVLINRKTGIVTVKDPITKKELKTGYKIKNLRQEGIEITRESDNEIIPCNNLLVFLGLHEFFSEEPVYCCN